jgi:Holliday junction resolvase RusA-like endonuclease
MNKITILQTLAKDIKKLGKDMSLFYCVIKVEPYSKSNFTKFGKNGAYTPERMQESDRIVAAECARVMGQFNIQKYEGPLFMQIDGYFKNKRVFDAPNLSKSICDALSNIVYYDDRQIVSCICTKTYDKENPRIEIFIKQYDGEHDMVNIANLTAKELGEATSVVKPKKRKVVKRIGRKLVTKKIPNGTNKRSIEPKTK